MKFAITFRENNNKYLKFFPMPISANFLHCLWSFSHFSCCKNTFNFFLARNFFAMTNSVQMNAILILLFIFTIFLLMSFNISTPKLLIYPSIELLVQFILTYKISRRVQYWPYYTPFQYFFDYIKKQQNKTFDFHGGKK